MKQLLIIFTKSSQPITQLQQLYSISENVSAEKYIFYDGFVPVKELWDNQSYKKFIQLGVDKTEKVMNAFIKGFLKNYDEVVLIDNSSSDLQPSVVANAFVDLKFHEVVVGPVNNGSIYLLGMRRFRPEIFERDINHRNVISELQKRNISFKQLPLEISWISSKVAVN